MLLLVACLGASYTAVGVGSMIAKTYRDTRVAQEYLEGASLLSVEAWRSGGWSAMYPADFADPSTPLVITPYPPMFHVLWRGMAWVMQDDTYAPGRIVALLAALAILVCIYRIARLSGLDRLGACVFALCFLIPLPIWGWIGVARVDFPGLAFAFIGLLIYLRFKHRDDYTFLWCAVPFVLTGLTKQSLIAAPAAVLFTELAERRYQRAALFAGLTILPIVTVFLLLNSVTQGGFFNATVSSLADEIFYSVAAAMAVDLFMSNPIPGMLTLLAVSLWFRRDFRHRTVLLYAGTSMVMLLMTIAKPGANINYYIEPIAALCVAGAAGYAGLRARTRYRLLGAGGIAVAVIWGSLLVSPALSAFTRFKESLMRDSRVFTLPEDPQNRPVLVPASLVRLIEPPMPFYVNDDFTFSALAAWDKLLPADRITDDLRAHRVGAVLVSRPFVGPEAPSPAFIGDWQGGWNFWSVEAFREALFEAYARVDVPLPLDMLLFVPKGSVVRFPAGYVPPASR